MILRGASTCFKCFKLINVKTCDKIEFYFEKIATAEQGKQGYGNKYL